ncbi:glycosyltransferase [Crocinitomicaceae bacterium CZZ-1]|uniref:Glycosyltransferase n=1 Tax=Taishania pollutisoli TaxID=2766479 RepID=A0A8J6TSG8_9FLAO|nr:glycosyltransferase [Taishania pollutisoli]MBC9811259.1 glycosyltransferase [Taishania pollutisoli]MBX2947826.1 glycosyltransferase [Crocinitomicaceae bacterium]NGF75042.1 glycosyltransferase [Fluviicola sp. SGL-29]
MKKVAVLIPCYNEALTIEKVVKDFQQHLPEAAIYVFDNNSTDNSVEIATNAGAIVERVYQQGKGNVIRTMFRTVEADCYLMIDGDDTYPAEEAVKIIQPILEGRADMVTGDRLSSTYFTENKRAFHNTGNKLVRSLINTIWKKELRDIMSGYRAFSESFVKLFPVMTSGFEIETEMTIHALDKRLSIVEVPIQYKDRPEGSESKLRTFSDGFKVIKTIVTLFKEYKPLLFFGWLSVLLIGLAVLFFIPVFIEYIEIGLVPRFPTFILSVFLALSGIISLFTGLILDVLVQKNRKEYEIKWTEFYRNSRR